MWHQSWLRELHAAIRCGRRVHRHSTAVAACVCLAQCGQLRLVLWTSELSESRLLQRTSSWAKSLAGAVRAAYLKVSSLAEA